MTARWPWMATATDLGLDLHAAVHHDTYASLDKAARDAGAIGGTYATGDPVRPRRGYVQIGDQLHVGPALHMMASGAWLGPGQNPAPLTGRDRLADEAADRWERHVDTMNGSPR